MAAKDKIRKLNPKLKNLFQILNIFGFISKTFNKICKIFIFANYARRPVLSSGLTSILGK